MDFLWFYAGYFSAVFSMWLDRRDVPKSLLRWARSGQGHDPDGPAFRNRRT